MLAAKHGATAKGTSHSSWPSSADPSSGAGPSGQQQQTGTSLGTSHAAAAAQLEPSPAGRGGDAAGAAPGGVGAAARKRAKHTLSPAAAKRSSKQQQQAAAEAEEAEAPKVFELPAGPPLPLPRVEVVPVEQLDLSQQKNLRTITVGRAVLYQASGYPLLPGGRGGDVRLPNLFHVSAHALLAHASTQVCASAREHATPRQALAAIWQLCIIAIHPMCDRRLLQYNLREGPDGVMYRVYSRSIM